MSRIFRPLFTGLSFFVIVLVLCSCSPAEKKNGQAINKDLLTLLGDSISMLAQKTLLQKVSGAIAEGGPVHAIAFCNLNAMPLTDSIARANSITLRRVTDKTRNAANKLNGEREIALFQQIADSLKAGNIKPQYLLEESDGRISYYKPILLGMPACLQCHGTPGKEIENATIEKIKEKYPDDAATGYSLGQLRGMWKITMNTHPD